MEFAVILERDEEGSFIAKVPELPGCITWAPTKKDALERIREAIALYLEARGRPKTPFVSIETVRVEA